jgi:hypothetical protein
MSLFLRRKYIIESEERKKMFWFLKPVDLKILWKKGTALVCDLLTNIL